MLSLNVNFVAGELTPGLVNGNYEVEQGVTVMGLLEKCELVCGVKVPEKNLQYLHIMFNGRPIRLEDSLNEDGKLQFCRIVFGG